MLRRLPHAVLLVLFCGLGAPVLARGNDETKAGFSERLKTVVEGYSQRIDRARALAASEPTLREDLLKVAAQLEGELKTAVEALLRPTPGGTAPPAPGAAPPPPPAASPAPSPAPAGTAITPSPPEALTLNPKSVTEGSKILKGTTPLISTEMEIEVRINGVIVKKASKSEIKTTLAGEFEIGLPAPLAAGDKVAARLISPAGTGPWSAELETIALPPTPVLKTPIIEGGTKVAGAASSSAKEVTVSVDGKDAVAGPTDGQGAFDLTLPTALRAGQKVAAKQKVGDLQSKSSGEATVEAAGYDWGRVRAQFSSGVEFSKERNDFSEQDLFLRFELDKNWKMPGPAADGKEESASGWYFNTFFDTIVAAIPVVTKDASGSSDNGSSSGSTLIRAGEAGDGGNGTGSGGSSQTQFLSSRKAALLRVGAYVPIIFNFMEWDFKQKRNAVFFAPFGKFGVETITDGETDTRGEESRKDDVFNFWSLGVRLGHFAFERDGRGAFFAPETISYFDASFGRFESFETTMDEMNAEGKMVQLRQRPIRFNFEGNLKIPEVPLNVGFSANVGKGPDDIRFFFGTRFDIGKVFAKLKKYE